MVVVKFLSTRKQSLKIDVIIDLNKNCYNVKSLTKLKRSKTSSRLVLSCHPSWSLPSNTWVFDYKVLQQQTQLLEANVKYLLHCLSHRRIRPMIDRYITPAALSTTNLDDRCGDIIVEHWRS